MSRKITTIDEMVDKINRLTIKDLQNVAEKVLTGKVITSNGGTSLGLPSIVMQGERETFGDVEFILRRYGLGNYKVQKSRNQEISVVIKMKRRKESLVLDEVEYHSCIYTCIYTKNDNRYT